jgi:hypothetical protein
MSVVSEVTDESTTLTVDISNRTGENLATIKQLKGIVNTSAYLPGKIASEILEFAQFKFQQNQKDKADYQSRMSEGKVNDDRPIIDSQVEAIAKGTGLSADQVRASGLTYTTAFPLAGAFMKNEGVEEAKAKVLALVKP